MREGTRPRRSALRSLHPLVILALVASLLSFGGSQPAAGAAQGGIICHSHASSTGNDGNDGSEAAPVRTIRVLASLLGPGETGCLRAGDEFASPGDGTGSIQASGAEGNPITLRSGPGGRATLRGQFEVTGSNVILRDLNFHGYIESAAQPNFKGKFLNVLGDNVQILNNDITSAFGICVGAGSAPNNVRADNFVLDGNRIHGCGLSNVFQPSDSGSHGAYIEHTLNATITNNAFYDNRVRGLQLYPKAIDSYVANNVLNGNSGNLNIGGENGNYPTGNLFENNIITNSTFTGNNKDSAEVHGFMPNDGQTYGNVVRNNCIFNATYPDRLFDGYGYAGDESTNTIADPLYVDAANKDFSLQRNSPCAGKGPVGWSGGEPDPGSSTDEMVSLTVINVNEASQPLLHSCFQLYAEDADIYATAPLFDLCDAQESAADGQVTFTVAPGTYILHQTWIDDASYEPMEPAYITVTSEPEQVFTVRAGGASPAEVQVTILNVNESGQPLLHSCFQIYPADVDIYAATPLFDLCDAQESVADGQVTFILAPGTYTLHQTWIDDASYVPMEPAYITVTSEPEQVFTVQAVSASQGGSGGGTYPAGWYGPYDDGCNYWWDGTQWSGHYDCNGDGASDI